MCLFLLVGAAWFLEEDVERGSSLECDTHTDSTPFSYNTTQTYYSSAPSSPDCGNMVSFYSYPYVAFFFARNSFFMVLAMI